jgi:5-carboxymethyl-2-hydroxymuconate isomerase
LDQDKKPMPHLRLEYSTNIKERLNPEELFSSCHKILVDTINADLFRCQSRAIPLDFFHIGDGSSREAFIYLEFFFFEGRSLSKLKEMEQQILKVLEKYFFRSLQELNVQIGIRVIEFPSSHYMKIESRK